LCFDPVRDYQRFLINKKEYSIISNGVDQNTKPPPNFGGGFKFIGKDLI